MIRPAFLGSRDMANLLLNDIHRHLQSITFLSCRYMCQVNDENFQEILTSC